MPLRLNGERSAAIAIAIAGLSKLVRRFASAAYRRFVADRCLIGAGALSYSSLVSLVPLTALVLVTFSGFSAFGERRDRLLQTILESFAPSVGDQAAAWFSFAANNAAQSTAVGVGSLIVTSVLLLATIEDQFQLIFQVATPRGWGQRVLVYWTMLTLGPLLVGLGMSASGDLGGLVRGLTAGHATVAAVAEGWGEIASRLLAYVLEGAAIATLYVLVPNCRVRWVDGMVGAAVAVALLVPLKVGFTVFVAQLASYSRVYGALASVPIFLLWMYIFWVALLLGAELTAALGRRATSRVS